MYTCRTIPRSCGGTSFAMSWCTKGKQTGQFLRGPLPDRASSFSSLASSASLAARAASFCATAASRALMSLVPFAAAPLLLLVPRS